MAYIRKRLGKFTVAIRKRHGQQVYKTFDLKSDALRFAKETELQIQQNRYRDISEASKTSLRIVLHRYIREKIKNKPDKARERSNFNRKIYDYFKLYNPGTYGYIILSTQKKDYNFKLKKDSK